MSKVAHYKNNALSTPIDIGSLKVNKFLKGVNDVRSSLSLAQPESEALNFYMLNHLTANVLQGKPDHAALSVGEQTLVDSYYTGAATAAIRAIAYLFLITVREARHSHSGLDYTVWAKKKFGVSNYEDSERATVLVQFHNDIRGLGATACIDKLCNTNFDTVTVKELVGMLQYIFYNGSFSSAYGGKAWGVITDVLYNYVVGAASAEVTLDTVFTLAHNTGAIFNKGYLYHAQIPSKLQVILDVQRSGQIPELVISGDTFGFGQSPALLECGETALDLGMYSKSCTVDWQKVMDLGSVGEYHHKLPNKGFKNTTATEPTCKVSGAKVVGTLDIAGISHQILKLARVNDSPAWSTK